MRKHYRIILISGILSKLNQILSSTDVMKGLVNSRIEVPLSHTDLLECIDSGIGHLPDGLDGFVQALYAIGGEAPQFLHPNSPYFAQDPKYWGICLLMAIEAKSKNHSAGNCAVRTTK